MTALPERIGRYEIEAALPPGGTAFVYQARHPLLGIRVAVKVLTAESAADADRKREFLHEGRIASTFRHDNVVRVYDYAEEDGRPYMVMEYLEGPNLAECIEGRSFGSALEKLNVVRQIASALEHIHGEGIIHRDVKPQNFILSSTDRRVKLIDFGIAKKSDTWMTQMTQPGFSKGTPYYMAPEQTPPPGEQTHLVDIYAFGVVLFEVITEKKWTPLDVGVWEMFRRIREDPLDLDQVRLAGAPESLIDLIARCTQKEPGNRIQSFADVGLELDAIVASLSGEWTDDRSAEENDRSIEAGDTPGTDRRESLSVVEALRQRGADIFGRLQETLTGVSGRVAGSPNPLRGRAMMLVPVLALVAVLAGAALLVTRLDPLPVAPTGVPAVPRVPVAPPSEDIQLEWLPPSSSLGAYEAAERELASGDTPQALEDLRTVAEAGYAPAQFRMGWLYDYGWPGVTEDDTEAVAWYRKAAEQDYAPAQTNLGWMYATGQGGLEKNDAGAVEWFGKAAERADPRAQTNLGVMYSLGLGGLAADDAQAFMWFRSAADRGDARAMYNLAVIYQENRGVGSGADSARLASELYQAAADAGYAPALQALANSSP